MTTAVGSDASGISGFAILDKDAGVTSFSYLAAVARKLGQGQKHGHAGTLDSFATGVLVCLFGRYTRLSDWFMSSSKVYEAEILFGEETDTLDPEGQVTARAPVPDPESVKGVLPGFTGTIMQVPPVYSAVHVSGQRAYQRARLGQDVPLEARPVTISELSLLSYTDGIARIRVACSKGTYIRSLARDLAIAAGSRGRLKSLRRLASGPFQVENAWQLGSFDSTKVRQIEPEDALGLGLGILTLEHSEAKAFSGGIPLARLSSFRLMNLAGNTTGNTAGSTAGSTAGNTAGSKSVAVFDDSGAFMGMVVSSGNSWKYGFVMGTVR